MILTLSDLFILYIKGLEKVKKRKLTKKEIKEELFYYLDEIGKQGVIGRFVKYHILKNMKPKI